MALSQSTFTTKLRFFHNDFAGRLSSKVMQTALAVREFCMILGDMIAYVVIYFITISVVFSAISPCYWFLSLSGFFFIFVLVFILYRALVKFQMNKQMPVLS